MQWRSQALVGGIGVGLYPQIKDLFVHVQNGSARNQTVLSSVQSFSPVCAASSSGLAPLSFTTKVVAGATSGVIGQLIAAPTCVVKVRLQADARLPVPRYHGTMDAFAKIPQQEGFRSLFRGIVPSLQRAAVMYGATISTYDHIKHALVDRCYHGDSRAMDFVSTHVAASSVSGFVASVVSTPFDTIKTRIISQAVQPRKSILGITPLVVDGPPVHPSQTVLYSSTIDCVVKTVRSEGFLAIYKVSYVCIATLYLHAVHSLSGSHVSPCSLRRVCVSSSLGLRCVLCAARTMAVDLLRRIRAALTRTDGAELAMSRHTFRMHALTCDNHRTLTYDLLRLSHACCAPISDLVDLQIFCCQLPRHRRLPTSQLSARRHHYAYARTLHAHQRHCLHTPCSYRLHRSQAHCCSNLGLNSYRPA
jgi:hypothetical protein